MRDQRSASGPKKEAKRVWDGSLTSDGLKVNMIRFFFGLIIFIDQSLRDSLGDEVNLHFQHFPPSPATA